MVNILTFKSFADSDEVTLVEDKADGPADSPPCHQPSPLPPGTQQEQQM